ncbi:MAG: DUF302 domain-containing protein [Bacteroidetes bacterium]|nr:DUF302 domain-containing protein [Bacteroidota bacterium]
MNYGLSKKVDLSYENAIVKVTEELKKDGFGILTEIDVKATLKKKLDVDVDKYIILGACNPGFAHQALQIENELGLLLPCNTIIYEKEGEVFVSIMNPEIMSSVVDNEKLVEIANDVKNILQKVLDRV